MILDGLRIAPAALAAGTGWVLKPDGLCRGPVCVPIATEPGADGSVDVRAVAERLGMPLVRDDRHDLWALGPEATGRTLESAELGPVVLSELDGTPFELASLRGRKVVVHAWASWCGCCLTLPAWRQLRDELAPLGVEVVTVALDVDPEMARPWVEAAAPTHPALVDPTHELDARLGITNVPSAMWVDEDGRIVRPPEIALVEGSDLADLPVPGDLPTEMRELLEEVAKIPDFHDEYVAALRDWAEHGAGSRYALAPDEVVARSRPRNPDEARAAAHFELGAELHRRGDADGARPHFREAHRLHPDNWTYKRQAWELASPGMQAPTEHYRGDFASELRRVGGANLYPPFRP